MEPFWQGDTRKHPIEPLRALASHTHAPVHSAEPITECGVLVRLPPEQHLGTLTVVPLGCQHQGRLAMRLQQGGGKRGRRKGSEEEDKTRRGGCIVKEIGEEEGGGGEAERRREGEVG